MNNHHIPKSFRKWMRLKSHLHNSQHIPYVSEAQIWWASLGNNVGTEIDGKGKNFLRPVVIFRKLGSLGCVAIPLTSKPHEGSWYVHFQFQNRDEYAALAQIRVLSTARLFLRMGTLSQTNYKAIANGLKNLLFP